MHDTVSRTRKRVRSEPAQEGVAGLVSRAMQSAGLARALTDPLSGHLELLYLGAHRWLTLSQQLVEPSPEDTVLGELTYASSHIRTVLGELIPFLERAEDILSEREEITHRESSYEREVSPFSRLDSTEALRAYLTSQPGFDLTAANEGAQIEGDLLKVIYLEGSFRNEAPKPADLFAMVSELLLDCRRHLEPALDPESEFMRALQKSAKG